MKIRMLTVAVFLTLVLTRGAIAQNLYYLPHIANGNSGIISYRMTFILFNNSNAAVTAQASLTGDNGSPLNLAVGGFGTDSQFTVSLDAGIRVLSGVTVTGTSQSIVGASNMGLSVPTVSSELYSFYTPFGSNFTLTFVPPAPKP